MLGSKVKTGKAQNAPFAVSARQRQKGAYAVEFAFVFIIFFIVLYGIITYGLIFAAQQSLNFAAESGARAGMQWQAGTPEDEGIPEVTPLKARAVRALAVAKDHVEWVDQMAGSNILKIAVCSGNSESPLADSGNLVEDDKLCKLADPNKLEVVIRYPYKDASLTPTILEVAVPNVLEGRASVDLGIALDRSAGG